MRYAVFNQKTREDIMVVGTEQARILVVSASPYTRYVISGELSSEPDLFVVGTARTTEEINYKQALLRPDLAVVDLESSRDLLDLEQALSEVKLPVLALCSHTDDGAELAFAALEAGVADVIARPNSKLGIVNFAPDLSHKVRALTRVRPRPTMWRWPNSVPCSKACPRPFLPGDRLVIVSAAVGGLGPLIQLLAALPADLKATLLVLTSLPGTYLSWFLTRIAPVTAFCLRQAHEGSSLNSGVATFAPHDFHLTVGTCGRLALDRGLRHNGARPSADLTMSSLATQYGPAVIGVILSGLGSDGAQGSLDIYAAGGTVIVQERTTCLADETPTAVIESGAAVLELPPEQVGAEIVRQSKHK
jgi:two-component system chemotaxis response regulator CheB